MLNLSALNYVSANRQAIIRGYASKYDDREDNGGEGDGVAAAEVRQTTQRIADDLGTSFSAVVADALMGWVRGRLVDAWLADHQAVHGSFEEEELRALAQDAGVPYLPQGRVAQRRS